MSVRIFLVLLLLCFLTGLFLNSLGISARGMLHDAGHTILLVGRLLERAAAWAIPYVLLGAVVVVPAAVVLWALRRAWRG